MSYIFVAEIDTGHGIRTAYLDQALMWCSATNTALKFNSPKEASEYWKRTDPFPVHGICTVRIEGPRKGIYRITTGERIR